MERLIIEYTIADVGQHQYIISPIIHKSKAAAIEELNHIFCIAKLRNKFSGAFNFGGDSFYLEDFIEYNYQKEEFKMPTISTLDEFYKHVKYTTDETT